MPEWLESLKEGDRVIAKGGPMGTIYLQTVASANKTKIKLSNNFVFSRKTGLEIPSDTHYPWRITPVTEKSLEQIRRNQLLHEFNKLNFSTLSYQQLKAMKSAMEANAPAVIETKNIAVAAPAEPLGLEDELEEL